MEIGLSTKDVVAVVKLLKGWATIHGRDDEKYWDQDGKMVDIRAQLQTLTQKVLEQHTFDLEPLPVQFGVNASEGDVALCFVLLAIAKAILGQKFVSFGEYVPAWYAEIRPEQPGLFEAVVKNLVTV